MAHRIATTSDDTARVFREHAPAAWQLLRRLGVAEDQVSSECRNVFLVVHDELGGFEGRSTLRAWVFGICVRAAALYQERSSLAGETKTAPVVGLPALGDESAIASGREARAALDGLTLELESGQRTAFVLFEVLELTLAEVAYAMDAPRETTEARLLSARARVSEGAARLAGVAPSTATLGDSPRNPEEEPARFTAAQNGDAAVRFLGGLIERGREEIPSETELAELAAKLGPVLHRTSSPKSRELLLGRRSEHEPRTAPATPLLETPAAKGIAIAAMTVAVLVTLWQVHAMSDSNEAVSPQPPATPSALSEVPVASGEPNATNDPLEPPQMPTPTGVEPKGESRGLDPVATPSSLPFGLPAPSSLSSLPSPPRMNHERMDAGAIAPGTQAALLLQQRAGQALKNGRPAETLSACDQSAKLYAQVPLAEGCEILAVGALVSLGRTDEANARANAFRAKYPNSTLAPNLDRILSTKSDDR